MHFSVKNNTIKVHQRKPLKLDKLEGLGVSIEDRIRTINKPNELYKPTEDIIKKLKNIKIKNPTKKEFISFD
jgi:hypothetical protein